MAEMAKFLFDTVFDPKETPDAPASTRPEKTYWSTDERETARTDGFERGRQSGIDESNTTIAARTATALETIAANVSTLTGQLENQRQQLKSEGVILANMIARSLATALIAREPLHEIEALFDEVLNFLPNTPHIVIRLDETLLEAAKEKLDAVAAQRGFQGKLILVGQSEIDQGDCRIEWAQGGIVKDRKLIKQRIFEITNQHIEAPFTPDEMETSGPENLSDQLEAAGQPEEIQND
jgi:flagellar assembly protein FliH